RRDYRLPRPEHLADGPDPFPRPCPRRHEWRRDPPRHPPASAFSSLAGHRTLLPGPAPQPSGTVLSATAATDAAMHITATNRAALLPCRARLRLPSTRSIRPSPFWHREAPR